MEEKEVNYKGKLSKVGEGDKNSQVSYPTELYTAAPGVALHKVTTEHGVTT